MLRIVQTYLINATPEEIWAALTQPALQRRWTGAHAEYDARLGGTYKLWDDYVTGEITQYDAPRVLSQTWKPNDWTIDDSVVTFTLTPAVLGTQVDLLHENVQPEDYEGTTNGWREVYIGAIKTMLESEPAKPKPKRKRAAKKKSVAKKKKSTRK